MCAMMKLVFVNLLVCISVATAGHIPFIVGGRDATKGKWLCQASIETTSGFHTCGAAVVGPRHLLTAAHCIANALPTSRRIVVGQYDRKTRNGYKPAFHKISKFIVHPEYRRTRGFPNDVGIIVLEKEIDFSNEFVKACPMAASDAPDFAGKQCTITGWGRLYGGGPTPNNLQEADVDILSQGDCTNVWGSDRINNGHICLWDAVNKKRGACHGDSGGPLFCSGDDGVTYIAGLTSWGNRLCLTTFPSVYSRVSYFREWFDKVMK